MEQRIVEVLEEITKALKMLEKTIPSPWSAPGSMRYQATREFEKCLSDIENKVENIKNVMGDF